MTVIQGEMAAFSFRPENRIHLDVLEMPGTFYNTAAHQSLDTL
ncbi:hypothetical protein [Bradyrhizobium sp.]|nr:hypothetical protein [Bradyrhizobium sp.]